MIMLGVHPQISIKCRRLLCPAEKEDLQLEGMPRLSHGSILFSRMLSIDWGELTERGVLVRWMCFDNVSLWYE